VGTVTQFLEGAGGLDGQLDLLPAKLWHMPAVVGPAITTGENRAADELIDGSLAGYIDEISFDFTTDPLPGFRPFRSIGKVPQ
jgi:hypothetical protein